MARVVDSPPLTLPLGLIALAALILCLGLTTRRPWLLANTTPSEPPGLYMGTWQTPRVGRLVAFKAPTAAFTYADHRLAYLHRVPLLKAIAAGPGDRVCTLTGRLQINGQDRAPIATVDHAGHTLPRWRGCRALGPRELFLYSDRVPNSFDSRYFGPVDRTSVLGVFVPVMTDQGPR